MVELAFLSASEAVRRFSNGSLSPVDYLETLFDQTDRLDPQLHVYVAQDRDRAMAAARNLHTAIRGNKIGPFAGIPVGVKDVFDVEGFVTTCGSRVPAPVKAHDDAASVRFLRQAGALFPGKTQTLEFATGGPGFDLPFPPSRNPWDPARYSGGSSSGSGVGVAAGMFPIALGSDTGGSVRNPASCCGVFGLKPTYGLISRRGVFPLSPSLDNVGFIARTVEDLAGMLDVCARYDARDASSVNRPAPACYKHSITNDIAGLRIGFVRHFHETDMVADPEIAASLESAALHFAKLGAKVTVVTLPKLNDFVAVSRTISAAEAWSIHADWIRTQFEKYGVGTRRRLVVGAFISSEDYLRAQRYRQRLLDVVCQAFDSVDLLLTASSMDLPPVLDNPSEIGLTLSRHARMPFNVTGHPALTLMSGLSKSNLPLSVQLVAPYWQETRLLSAAAAFEATTDWKNMHPVLCV